MSKDKGRISQVAEGRGKIQQTAGDHTENKTTTINANVFVGIFLIIVLALAGITWFSSIGKNENNQIPASQEAAPSSTQNE
ncbi:MAG: hypothetical protein AAFV90_24305 [Cyanobacteria bacterium J06634_5]